MKPAFRQMLAVVPRMYRGPLRDPEAAFGWRGWAFIMLLAGSMLTWCSYHAASISWKGLGLAAVVAVGAGLARIAIELPVPGQGTLYLSIGDAVLVAAACVLPIEVVATAVLLTAVAELLLQLDEAWNVRLRIAAWESGVAACAALSAWELQSYTSLPLWAVSMGTMVAITLYGYIAYPIYRKLGLGARFSVRNFVKTAGTTSTLLDLWISLPFAVIAALAASAWTFSLALMLLPISALIYQSQRAALAAEHAHRAHHDPLTGIPNRLGMYEYGAELMRRADRAGQNVVALLGDVDRFKLINDTMGHAKGDEVLKRVSAAMVETMQGVDHVLARFGGEEFAILVAAEPVDDRLLLGELARVGVEQALEDIGGSISIGVSEIVTLTPHNLADPTHLIDDMIEHADVALYAAKHGGRNCVRLHEPDSDEPDPSIAEAA